MIVLDGHWTCIESVTHVSLQFAPCPNDAMPLTQIAAIRAYHLYVISS